MKERKIINVFGWFEHKGVDSPTSQGVLVDLPGFKFNKVDHAEETEQVKDTEQDVHSGVTLFPRLHVMEETPNKLMRRHSLVYPLPPAVEFQDTTKGGSRSDRWDTCFEKRVGPRDKLPWNKIHNVLLRACEAYPNHTLYTIETGRTRQSASQPNRMHYDSNKIADLHGPGEEKRLLSVTYAEAKVRVYQVARALRTLGAKSGYRIGLMLQNSPAYLELYFASSLADLISVQLNPRLAAPELRGILQDSGCSCIVVDYNKDMIALLLEVGLGEHCNVEMVIWVNHRSTRERRFGIAKGPHWVKHNGLIGVAQCDYEDLATMSADNWREEMPETRAISKHCEADEEAFDGAESSVATLFYTSGTTGRPKGVMLTHSNILWHALHTREIMGWKHGGGNPIVWGHFAPMFHVGDAWAVFATTEVGGCHVFCPKFEIRDILSSIESNRVEYTKIVPTMLQLIVDSPEQKQRDLSSLKMIVSGGAPLRTDVIRRTIDVMQADLLQDYGMTECACHITIGRPEEERLLPEEVMLETKKKAGKVFKGMEIKIVDPGFGDEVMTQDSVKAGCNGLPLEPPEVPTGEVGELWVRGRNLFAGYWRKPEETKKVMWQGWFRTGDLGHLDFDGYYVISDRKKDMIITGGENVFSIEVETVLQTHKNVRAAAAYGTPNKLLGEVVVAAVSIYDKGVDTDVLLLELKRLCASQLAPYKIPRSIKIVDDFPRGPTGKIQKHVLRRGDS